MAANDNKLDEEQQLGVIAAHKSKFTTFVKGPTAVKEIKKATVRTVALFRVNIND